MDVWLWLAVGYLIGRGGRPRSTQPVQPDGSVGYAGWICVGLVMTAIAGLWLALVVGHPFLTTFGVVFLVGGWLIAALGCLEVHRTR